MSTFNKDGLAELDRTIFKIAAKNADSDVSAVASAVATQKNLMAEADERSIAAGKQSKPPRRGEGHIKIIIEGWNKLRAKGKKPTNKELEGWLRQWTSGQPFKYESDDGDMVVYVDDDKLIQSINGKDRPLKLSSLAATLTDMKKKERL